MNVLPKYFKFGIFNVRNVANKAKSTKRVPLHFNGISKKDGKDQETIQSSTTPDTGYLRESNKNTINIANKLEVNSFPEGDHKAAMNRLESKKHKTQKHKRSTALERSVKYLTGGLKPVSRHQPHP